MNKVMYIIISIVLAIFLLLILFSSCESCGAGTDKSSSDIETIESSEEGFKGIVTPNEFSEMVETGEYIVLDLRTQEEYDQGYISEDPLFLDYYKEDFKVELNKLEKEKKYLIYCNSGNRSSYTVPVMNRYGFTEFYELEGGISAWNSVGLKTY